MQGPIEIFQKHLRGLKGRFEKLRGGKQAVSNPKTVLIAT
jgi:hypothetical protein